MAMPTVPPIVLTYKSEMNFTKALQPRAPEEAKSTRRCSHILKRHSSLQSNERDLERDQQLRV
jgi:hypothetical protein